MKTLVTILGLAALFSTAAHAAYFAPKYVNDKTSCEDLKIELAGELLSLSGDLTSVSGEIASAEGTMNLAKDFAKRDNPKYRQAVVNEAIKGSTEQLDNSNAVLDKAYAHLQLLAGKLIACQKAHQI